MNDQAQALRNLIKQRTGGQMEKNARLLTVTSGKGGVGKSNFSLNFGLALQSLGRKVLVIDADIGMANLDVLMGIPAPYSLYHLFTGDKSIRDIIQLGPSGLHFIAGGSGFRELLHLTDRQLQEADEQLGMLQGEYDFILFDTGAGLTRESERFIQAAHETFVVTTPEPTSITDAYALVKMVSGSMPDTRFRVVVNRAFDEQEGRQTAAKMDMAADRFLGIRLPYGGYVADDGKVGKAVRTQKPVLIAYPDSDAARNIMQIARQYLDLPADSLPHRSVKGILQQWFSRKR
ncbi:MULTISPECIES: MinD/ParA family protein [unclassified Paenibacillus]|uniref:MinD/ParA family protein n=1 Tax=unclassified Paenibacillus TaxID=185978 RepID=UPI0009560409|nr:MULTISPECIES: MinD/ParA family protein [unclassified Paenibacillus]ASS65699.1 MinD/ParA family protein [Paenibacillus sp. RUD330]SIQ26936.1 flagellar biosynthesis protein FlhG [Paenibacillus sp. RU4X]SIQ48940.1 flagellar biosynthesis protein FlhG [Paenibacillus sp. RU4T]